MATDSFDEAELPALLETARKNNAALNITGMLLYHERSFIQALTGPEDAVISLYEHIKKDTRHENSRTLFRGNVDERTFEDWTMGFYNTNANKAEALPGLNDVLQIGISGDDEEDRVIQVLSAFREGRWRQAVNA